MYFVYIWSSCVEWQFLDRGALAWTFQFDLHFRWKILANLTANWKTRGLTKPVNEIINTIKHHGIWVIHEQIFILLCIVVYKFY